MEVDLRTLSSIGVNLIPDEFLIDLDNHISHQSPEGTWDPGWSWGYSYPETWEQVKQEWRGLRMFETLTVLTEFHIPIVIKTWIGIDLM